MSYFPHSIDIVEVTEPGDDDYPEVGFYVQANGVCETEVQPTLRDAKAVAEGLVIDYARIEWQSHDDVNGAGQSYWTLRCDCDDDGSFH